MGKRIVNNHISSRLLVWLFQCRTGELNETIDDLFQNILFTTKLIQINLSTYIPQVCLRQAFDPEQHEAQQQ
ncbi:hypothetical protein EGO53_12315 [Serratia liquefaciens]|uniref:Uncharacterized protein n=1 Tax=Serratia liquefaciens TaxID=614 RepID=A0A515CWN7_SERLI|nr:hypothetical protein EGO53_12315 [Serratia liquefaciens]